MTSVQCLPGPIVGQQPAGLPSLDNRLLLRVGLASHKGTTHKPQVQRKPPKQTGIEALPDEVLAIITSQSFTAKDFCSLCQVSSRYKDLAVGIDLGMLGFQQRQYGGSSQSAGIRWSVERSVLPNVRRNQRRYQRCCRAG